MLSYEVYKVLVEAEDNLVALEELTEILSECTVVAESVRNNSVDVYLHAVGLLVVAIQATSFAIQTYTAKEFEYTDLF